MQSVKISNTGQKKKNNGREIGHHYNQSAQLFGKPLPNYTIRGRVSSRDREESSSQNPYQFAINKGAPSIRGKEKFSHSKASGRMSSNQSRDGGATSYYSGGGGGFKSPNLEK
jgi:hypothetical protein